MDFLSHEAQLGSSYLYREISEDLFRNETGHKSRGAGQVEIDEEKLR